MASRSSCRKIVQTKCWRVLFRMEEKLYLRNIVRHTSLSPSTKLSPKSNLNWYNSRETTQERQTQERLVKRDSSKTRKTTRKQQRRNQEIVDAVFSLLREIAKVRFRCKSEEDGRTLFISLLFFCSSIFLFELRSVRHSLFPDTLISNKAQFLFGSQQIQNVHSPVSPYCPECLWVSSSWHSYL